MVFRRKEAPFSPSYHSVFLPHWGVAGQRKAQAGALLPLKRHFPALAQLVVRVENVQRPQALKEIDAAHALCDKRQRGAQ